MSYHERTYSFKVTLVRDRIPKKKKILNGSWGLLNNPNSSRYMSCFLSHKVGKKIEAVHDGRKLLGH